VGAGVATAAPSAARRVLTLMLPVWAPVAVVSLGFDLGNGADVSRGGPGPTSGCWEVFLVFGACAPGWRQM